MEENNNIDQLFRHGMQQQFPVDEKLWAAVETRLAPTPNGKVGLWFFNLNTIALLMVLFICAIIPTDNVRTSILTTETALLKPVPNLSENNDTGLIEESTKEGSISTEPSEEVLNIKNNINQEKLDSKESITTPSTITNNKPYNKKEPNLTTIIKTDKNASSASFTSKSNEPSIPLGNKGILQSSGVKSKVTFASIDNKALFDANYTLGSSKSNYSSLSNKNLSITRIESLGPFEMSNISTNGVPLTINNTVKASPRRLFYTIELEVSMSISSQKSLSGDNADLIDFKKENETSLEYDNYGLNFINQYRFLTYGFGVHYSKYTERVSYTTPKETMGFNITYDTSYNLVNGNFNSNGVPVFLIEQEITEIRNPAIVIVDDNLIATNTFKRLRLPLFVGLQKNYKNWIAEARTAFVFNYLTDQEGVYINENLNRVESFDNQDQFNKMVYGHKSDFSIGYTFNEFVAFGTRFSYEYDINSFTKQYNSKLQNQNIGIWLMWRPQ